MQNSDSMPINGTQSMWKVFDMKTVDIIVPVMNEEEMLPIFYGEVSKVCSGISGYKFYFIFVDDGSTDKTASVLNSLKISYDDVGYISFSRNFGKEAAIYAGLSHAQNDIAILMDGDLEHPPALIPKMLEALEEGFDACGAKRKKGGFSKLFFKINNRMSAVKLKMGATDFMCMSRRFIDSVLELSETQRFSKGLFAWVGYDVKWLDYEQPVRPKGQSKWNFYKLFNYAADGITSFSVFPLRLVTLCGAIICLLAFVYIIYTVLKTLITGIDVPGYATILVVLLFLGGVILLGVGILGEYIGKIYMETKNRPLYIAKHVAVKGFDAAGKETNGGSDVCKER